MIWIPDPISVKVLQNAVFPSALKTSELEDNENWITPVLLLLLIQAG